MSNTFFSSKIFSCGVKLQAGSTASGVGSLQEHGRKALAAAHAVSPALRHVRMGVRTGEEAQEACGHRAPTAGQGQPAGICVSAVV